MAALATARVDIYLHINYMPLLDQLGLVEIVARMRREEWIRGQRDAGYNGYIPIWDDLGSERLAWIDTARQALEEEVNA